jgi:ATP-binding cassette, subfamily F, member 3
MKLDSLDSEADQDANRFLWGTDSKVHEMTNAVMDSKQQSSSKDRRKARQELERARREFSSKLEQAQQEAGTVSAMLLPDYSSGRNERDVQIKNVSLSLDNGRLLLNGSELKFAHKRRYGLVGKVGNINSSSS